ncbi:predicted protein [Sclerotinia sclerotiorum 1980 UF-70]|uniref:Uncharacterized protein n=1 Tax=Sclerotinia sclerotiorum (strain ATCC 18683 / 1980 / Ss-1) TaxID=665079 RepID=A7E593_SCLS1|nr:predicted protein [Sclerotinia sclerotiorum 1980 UF-70]EDN91065.1 predicted protein [Sclerotinia sclerotiorum 1980 UF-70]
MPRDKLIIILMGVAIFLNIAICAGFVVFDHARVRAAAAAESTYLKRSFSILPNDALLLLIFLLLSVTESTKPNSFKLFKTKADIQTSNISTMNVCAIENWHGAAWTHQNFST